jgi:RNA polymerase sigma factor (TIGR02999 family)
MPLVYAQLRRQAVFHLRSERPNHTLSPTALVNEAYLRLVQQRHVAWQNRAHFFGIAATAMRRVLVDHERGRRAAKRPDGSVRVALDDQVVRVEPPDCDVLLLHEALDDLAALDERLAQIVELRFFGGLAEQEVADLLKLSRSTVAREWQTARAWLYRRILHGRAPAAP